MWRFCMKIEERWLFRMNEIEKLKECIVEQLLPVQIYLFGSYVSAWKIEITEEQQQTLETLQNLRESAAEELRNRKEKE